MGIWDKLRGLFGGAPSPPPSPGPAASPPPPGPAASAPPPPAAGAPSRPAAAAAPARSKDPFTSKLLALSADELRKRALKINPMRTAWIGRVDTIPPQSDERTALIDRGLMLRGFLTEAQLDEIHRVGDLWIRHHEAVRLADSVAQVKTKEILQARAEERKREKEAKKRAAAERERTRQEGVARRKREDIIFLGRGVSSRLHDRRAEIERLAVQGLPVLAIPADVARALELSIPQLRGLAFHSEAAERTHYVHFDVPKRSGGTRRLSAPLPRLAKAQRYILRNILDLLPTEEPAHGFVQGRSTLTNAQAHVGRDVVVNLDLKDFFPSIGFRRVRGVFTRLGYSPAAATLLALLTTESPRQEVRYEGQRYQVALGERCLPQGACTSPALSNQVARKLDRRLAGMAAKLGWAYTRYADDLCFSAPPGKRQEIPRLLAKVRHIVGEEGFSLNPKKGRLQRKRGRQTVTGLVVNKERPRVPRAEIRRLRAILHNARKTGLEAQNRAGHPSFRAHLEGRIAYVMMADRARGEALRRALEAL